jgi:hypothetical protein
MQMPPWQRSLVPALTAALWSIAVPGIATPTQDAAQPDEALRAFELRAEDCYRGAMLALAREGVSDLGDLITFAHQACSGPLYKHLTKDLGRSDQQVKAYLRAIMVKTVGELRLDQRQ